MFRSANGCADGFSLYAHERKNKQWWLFICSNLSSLYFFVLYSLFVVVIVMFCSFLLQLLCVFTLVVFLLFVVAFDASEKKKRFVRYIYSKHFQFIAMHSKWDLVIHALFFFLSFFILLFVGVASESAT